MLSFFRVIKFAFQDMLRNFGLSFMTVLILVLMLLSVNTLFLVRILTSRATASIKNHVDVSVFFSPDAPTEKIAEVRKFIVSFPEVVTSTYYTSEESLNLFKSHYTDDKEILASLNEINDNPLGSTMVVKTREPQDYEKIIMALKLPEYEKIIVAKTFGDTELLINRIQVITSQVEKFSALLVLLFGVIAFLIIFNTIRVSIYSQRVEINIKKLVGATNWFVRGPYIIEVFFFSLLSAVLAVGGAWLAVNFLDPYVGLVFGEKLILTNYFFSNIIALFFGQLLAVLLLTIFSSALAMRRHLKV